MANINASGIIKAKVNDDIYTINPITRISDVDGLSSALSGKVDKENGKGLSTEDYTTAEKNKLSGIEANANDYVHPTTSGNKHIPSGGSSGKILGWSSDGTAAWVDPSGGGGGDVSSVKVGSTTYTPDSDGVVSLPAYPTSLPASDVYSWAKSSSKPSYSASEVGAVPTSRTINGYTLSANRTLTYSDVGAASSGHTHSTATTSSSGFMSYSDKSKLNRLLELSYTKKTLKLGNLSWTQSYAGLYYSAPVSVSGISTILSATICDFTSLRSDDMLTPIIAADYTGIGLTSNKNTFSDPNSSIDVIIIGIA